VEGYSEVAAAFREVASSEEAQAMGHLEFLQVHVRRRLVSRCHAPNQDFVAVVYGQELGDPVSNQPMGSTQENLQCAIVAETHDADVLYAEAAKTAKSEGFEDASRWFETVQQADKLHKRRFEKARGEL
jgi:rubrerythrin